MADGSGENDHNKRIDLLEDNQRETKVRLGEMDRRLMDQGTTLAHHSSKLDQIFQVVTQQQARPQFEASKALGVVRDVVLLILAVVGPAATLLVWMITTLTAANDRVQAVQIEYLASQVKEIKYVIGQAQSPRGWVPHLEPTQPKAGG